MSIWFCNRCNKACGPHPGNICPDCGDSLTRTGTQVEALGEGVSYGVSRKVEKCPGCGATYIVPWPDDYKVQKTDVQCVCGRTNVYDRYAD